MKRSYVLLLIVLFAFMLSFTGNGLQGFTRVLAQDSTGSQPTPEPLVVSAWTDEDSAQLTQFVTDTLKTTGIPGTAIGIVQNGQVVYTQGFGVRQTGGSDAVTPDTLFMIGSTTKAMTTLMMATVVDDGKVSWDTPERDIVPEFELSDPGRADSLTLRQMVCNCAGVPEHDTEMMFRGNSYTVPEMVQMLSRFPVSGTVGQVYHYSNQMVALGGYSAAIAASGGSLDTAAQNYADLMEQRVWGPIGMPHTTLSSDLAAASGNFASPHSFDLSGKYQALPLQAEGGVAPIEPAGGAWSSVNDMVRYLITQSQEGVTPDGKRIVSAANLAVTWQPQVEVVPGVNYGLGWLVGDLPGVHVLSHDGGTFGFSSKVTIFPDQDFGLVILTNTAEGADFNAAVQGVIWNLVLGLNADPQPRIQHLLALQPSIPADVSETVDENAVAPFLGVYTNPSYGDIEIKLDNGHLHVTSDGFDTELYSHHTADGKTDLYYAYNPPMVRSNLELTTDASGAPVVQFHIRTDDVPDALLDATFTRVE